MKTKTCLLLFFTLLTFASCKKDVVETTETATKKALNLALFPSTTNFNVHFPGTWAQTISEYTDNGYVLAGGINNNQGNNNQDIKLIKIDRQGNKVWEKVIGGSSLDRITSIVATTDSAYFICGTSRSNDGDFSGFRDFNLFIIKLDVKGNIIWVKAFLRHQVSEITSLIRTSDNNYLASGEGTIMKFDKDGKVLWTHNTGNALVYRSRVVEDKSGNFVLAGSCQPSLGKPSDFLLAKFDKNGVLVCKETYGGSLSEILQGITVDKDNNYVLLGYTQSNDGDVEGKIPSNTPCFIHNDAWMLKVNEDGKKLWAKVFGGTGDDRFVEMALLNNGDYLVAGYSKSNDFNLAPTDAPGTGEGWLIKINANGSFESSRRYDGEFIFLEKGDGNNYIAGGRGRGFGANERIWAMSIPSP